MRLHRLLGIIMLLDSRGTMKAGALARILETSERSIYRDIDILCEAGIPIMSIPGPTGGYSFMEGYRTNANLLEGSDIVNLLLSNMGIKPEGNTDSAHQLKNAIIKLENSISEEHRKEIIMAKERFFIDADPWFGKRIENKYVDILKESVLALRKIKIYYKKQSGEVSERILHPFGVVVKNSEWYVVGLCELKNDIRVFKCSRITEIEVLDESYSMPCDFNLEEFWRSSSQQFSERTSSKTAHNSYSVKIRLLEEKIKPLEGFHVYSSTKVGEYWVYDLDMLSLKTASSVLFPVSDRVEVMEPAELREYIIEKSKNILKIYNMF